MRASIAQVRDAVARLQAYGADVDYNSDATGVRITNRAGNAYLSPRLSTREVLAWLDGYSEAFWGGRDKREQA